LILLGSLLLLFFFFFSFFFFFNFFKNKNSSKSKSHSSSTSKHELATVEEGIDNLMRTIPNVDTSKKEKQLTKLKKKPKVWESDKEYFQSLLMKNLHLVSLTSFFFPKISIFLI